MRFDEVFEKVLAADDSRKWSRVVGSVFLDRPVETEHGWDHEGHSDIAVLRSDLSISLAWGLKCVEKFTEKWAKENFPNPAAHSDYVDVRYNGVPIFRTVYVSVDEGRAYLPMPTSRDMTVAKTYATFIGILHDLVVSGSDYMEYLNRGGLKLVDSAWPEVD